ncbi:peptidoglycan-binding domain-containing protein [Bradyrhizobium sp.]|uniref:peptidoglycan-binding domain-containing protein n=1 Tax=Bradyrhizobium sp. TaxID=376 RepID=UPI002D65A077|nr:peptidoglycan-binding domain-containing protein [Bradyrhizobium sp.]HZR76633.1 peptidoglycan-binding domain-containing protein [Bradyrhizobium sp.]
MRAAIPVLLILAIAACAPSAKAGLSETPRATTASVEPASLTDEATQQSEDQIGLTRTKRRDVQRRLTKLGYDTKANGKFDDATRDAISRWQEQHGYPKSGFLNTAQHQALLSESAAAVEASRSEHRSRGRRSRGIGGPIGAIGHVVGGILGR